MSFRNRVNLESYLPRIRITTLNIIPFPSPLRRGLGRGAGRGLPEGFHIWLNHEPIAV
jgi:hypothetical protein